jgi:beta-phosphoglucomutase
MKQKGVIFDLDGVIVDTAKFHYLAWKKIADDIGYHFTEKDNEELKGVSRVKSLDILIDKAGKSINSDQKKDLLDKKNNIYLELVSRIDQKEILPGIKEILEYLSQEKIPFSLGSASKNAPFILEKLQLKNKFNAIVDGNSVSKAKPDPEVFLIAAKKMGLKPEDCLVIEDAQAGIEAAKNAGMKTIGIGGQLKGADITLQNTSLLKPELINKLLSTKKETNNE